MGIWNRLFKPRRRGDLRPQRLDYLNEALALERQGDFDAALQLLDESLSVLRGDADAAPGIFIETLDILAEILREKSDYSGAIVARREALELMRASLGESHPNLAITLRDLGELIHQDG